MRGVWNQNSIPAKEAFSKVIFNRKVCKVLIAIWIGVVHKFGSFNFVELVRLKLSTVLLEEQ